MQPNMQEAANLVTFTGEILNGKLHFLCIFLYWPVWLILLRMGLSGAAFGQGERRLGLKSPST